MFNQNPENKIKKLLPFIGLIVVFVIAIWGAYKMNILSDVSKTNSQIVANVAVTQLPATVGQPIKWVKTYNVADINEKMSDNLEKLPHIKLDIKIEEELIEMSKEEAEKLGAEHEFGAKYPEMVSVYSLGPKGATESEPHLDQAFSIEFCGGPHVEHTGELAKSGTFKIVKEEAVAQGIRRIKAVLE